MQVRSYRRNIVLSSFSSVEDGKVNCQMVHWLNSNVEWNLCLIYQANHLNVHSMDMEIAISHNHIAPF